MASAARRYKIPSLWYAKYEKKELLYSTNTFLNFQTTLLWSCYPNVSVIFLKDLRPFILLYMMKWKNG